MDLSPYVTAGTTISQTIENAPPGTTVNGLVITIPTGNATDPTLLYSVQYQAVNSAGQTTLSPVHFVTLVSINGGFLGLGNFY